MEDNGQLKITNFGISERIGTKLNSTLHGPLDYVAPEILSERELNLKSDIWSLGVICYQLLSGTLPFHSKKSLNRKSQILKGNYRFPESFSECAKDFISKLLIVDPQKRMNVSDALKHEFITKYNK